MLAFRVGGTGAGAIGTEDEGSNETDETGTVERGKAEVSTDEG